MKKTKIAISGAYGGKNTGDEIILSSLISLIKKSIPDPEIIIFSFNPIHTMNYHRVASLSQYPKGLKPGYFQALFHFIFWKHLYSTIKTIKNSNIFLLGGGGLFEHKYPGVFFWINKILLAQLFKKPIIVYAVGVEPIWEKNPISKLLLKFTLKRIRYILVRDRISKKILLKLGIPSYKIKITADPSFYLTPEFLKYTKTSYKSTCRSICLIIRPLQYPWIKDKYHISHSQQKFNVILVKVLDNLIRKFNTDVYLLPVNYKDDYFILKDIYKRIHFPNKTVLLQELSIKEMVELLSSINLIISMRLHPLIIASIIKIPFLGIISHPKISKFLIEINQTKLGIYYEDLNDKNYVYKKIDYVLSTFDNLYEKKIYPIIQNFHNQTISDIKGLTNLIK